MNYYSDSTKMRRNYFPLFLLLSLLFLLSGNVFGANTYITSQDGDFDTNATWQGNAPNNGALDKDNWEINHSVTRDGNVTISRQGTVNGYLTIGDESNSYQMNIDWGGLIISDEATVEIWGSVYSSSGDYYDCIVVEDGGTLIIHGDLYVQNISIYGNVVVTGSLWVNEIDTEDDEGNTGNLVVSGRFNVNYGIEGDGDIYDLGDNPWSSNQDDTLGEDDLDSETDEDLLELLDSLGYDVEVSSVKAPTGFGYTLNTNSTTANLTWTKSVSTDSVIIAYSANVITWDPTDEKSYSEGTVSSGVKLLYKDTEEFYNNADLYTSGITYFKIWAVSSNIYSSGSSIVVESGDYVFFEDFESGSDDWSLGSYSGNYWGTNFTDEWYVGTAEHHNGTNSAYITNDDGESASYTKTTGAYGNTTITLEYNSAIDLSSLESAELQFYWKCKGESSADYGQVYAKANNGTNWGQPLDDIQLQGSSSWTKQTVDFSDYAGSSNVYLKFVWTYNNSDGSDPGFCIDDISIKASDVPAPSSLTATLASATEVDLVWAFSNASDEDTVILAYSTYGVLGSPISGTNYEVGDYISGGGEVIYKGLNKNYSQTDIEASGKIYYGVWAVNSSVYSAGKYDNVSMPVSLPYYQDFEDASDVEGWTLGEDSNNSWVIGSAATDDGKSAYITDDGGASTSYDDSSESTVDLTISVDLNDYATALLSFDYYCGGGEWYGNYYAYGQVLINGNVVTVDGNTRLYSKTTWQEDVTIDLSSYITENNGIATITFRWYNNNWDMNSDTGFCIDNVEITGTIEDPSEFKTVNDGSSASIDLYWDQNTVSDTVMVAWAEDEAGLGTPIVGKYYEEGDTIGTSGVILYKGIDVYDADNAYSHSPLNYATIYYYKAWSTRRALYSDGISNSENTPSKVLIFEEDWEDTSNSASWSTSNETNYWLKYGDDPTYLTSNNGSYYTYITNDGSTAGYNKTQSVSSLSITINLYDDGSNEVDWDELVSASLSFDWLCNGYSLYDGAENDAYGYVYVNGTEVGGDEGEYNRYFDNSGGTDWQNETVDLTSYIGQSVTIKFEWNNSKNAVINNPAFCIDNIEIGGSYTATSTIESGGSNESTISSIYNTSADAVNVLDVKFIDNVSANTITSTNIQKFVVGKGTANDIDNWSDAIAGAELRNTDGDVIAEGAITSASIVFKGEDMISIENTESATYEVYVWLNTDLNDNGIEDGDSFEFVVDADDIVTGDGDDFENEIADVSSGTVTIEVTATALAFDTEPSEYATSGEVLGTVPVVTAVDANGNIDTDFSGVIILGNSGITLTKSVESAVAVAGQAVFTSLTLTLPSGTNSATVTLTAYHTGDDFTSIVESTDVTVDAYVVPDNNSDSDFYINAVEIDDIDNQVSGLSTDGYGSYLDLKTTLERGSSYTITVDVYNDYSTGTGYGATYYTGYAYVWIDWDQDSDFDDEDVISLGSVTSDQWGSSIEELSASIDVPDDAEVGSTRMRVLFTTVEDSGADDDVSNPYVAETEDYTIIVTGEEWLGYTVDFTSDDNWSSGYAPDELTDVYIPAEPTGGKWPVVSGTIEINDLEIEDGATVTIEAGSVVTIDGDLMGTDGGLIIQNTDESPTSLIVEGTADADVSVEWLYSTAQQYWYIGHCVSGFTNGVYTTSLADPNDYYLFYWGGSYAQIAKTDTYTFDESLALKGYALLIKNADATVSYSGQLNLGSYSYSIANNEDYLIANPYSCYIDLESDGFDVGRAEPTIYTRTTLEDTQKRGYATYNLDSHLGTNGGTQYVAPGQSVWVEVLDDETNAEEVTMTPSVRVIPDEADRGSLKSVSSASEDILRVTLTSAYSSDEMVIAFSDDNGSNSFTRADSKKKFTSGGFANLYTVKEDVQSVIAVWPEISGSEEIPLAYQVASSGVSDFTFTFVGANQFASGYDPYLIDYETGAEINLADNNSYTFTPSATSSTDRFAVIFYEAEQDDITTETEDLSTSTSGVKIYQVEDKAVIEISEELLETGEATVSIYTVNGSLVDTFITEDAYNEFVLPQNQQMYLVKVNVSDQDYVGKIIK